MYSCLPCCLDLSFASTVGLTVHVLFPYYAFFLLNFYDMSTQLPCLAIAMKFSFDPSVMPFLAALLLNSLAKCTLFFPEVGSLLDEF
ncbi:hypothetical protein COLO4_03854 [Corchorus olitorius]|uniref:Uncharacterized protein n=1 Tax=Corchorus olitorius TaxID=93759 RepID=A0A1R3KWE7_9ROSI|nr:hypothetical protein COLO4_03854 [Corchorus olitorius]